MSTLESIYLPFVAGIHLPYQDAVDSYNRHAGASFVLSPLLWTHWHVLISPCQHQHRDFEVDIELRDIQIWLCHHVCKDALMYFDVCSLMILEIEHTGASSLREDMACEQQIIYWFSIWMHLCEWVCLFASYGWNKNRIDTFKIANFYTLQIICQPNVACLIPILSWNFLSNTTNFLKVTGT